MKQLIINADDFGFATGVNEGIVLAFKSGIVTSTTLMANGAAFDHAVELAGSNPDLPVGCHLSAIGGRALSSPETIPALARADGTLPATFSALAMGLARGAIRERDIEIEFRAQVGKLINSGIKPSHLDSHKHSHTHPVVMKALTRVAADFGIRHVRNPFEGVLAPRISGAAARNSRRAYWKQTAMSAAVFPAAIQFHRIVREYGLRTPDHFRGVRLTGLLDAEALRDLIRSIGSGTTELMCHPGICDDSLESAATRLKQHRQRELDALTDPVVKQAVEECGIALVSFREFV